MTRSANESLINIGSGSDLTILELAEMIARVVGFCGKIVLDRSKPDGTPRKLLDTSKISSLGWQQKIGLQEGLANTYDWFVKSLTERGLG
jgi:GDP-L-fucose synthase